MSLSGDICHLMTGRGQLKTGDGDATNCWPVRAREHTQNAVRLGQDMFSLTHRNPHHYLCIFSPLAGPWLSCLQQNTVMEGRPLF